MKQKLKSYCSAPARRFRIKFKNMDRESSLRANIEAGSDLEPDRQEQIMQEAAKGRIGVFSERLREGLSSVFKDPVLQKFLNMAPAIGDAIMGIKALHGKEGGRPLSFRERVFYSIASITGGVAWIAAARGKYKEAFVLNSVSEIFTQVDAWPAIIQDLASKAQNRDPQLSQVLATVGDWLERRKEDLKDLALVGNSLTQLNLRELPADER